MAAPGTKEPSRTIRVRRAAYEWLDAAARERGESMPEAVDHLIEELERWRFALATRAAYARLRRGPEAWADYRADIAELDGTVGDGLGDYPWKE